jgi:putative ABC transport system ATP-binding protein
MALMTERDERAEEDPPAVVLEARAVTRRIDAPTVRNVVDGVSLVVRAGEIVSVMGPSGSGKSSLLYVLAGLDPPTSGEVVVKGERMTGVGKRRLLELRRDGIGFVFQQFNLIPALTVAQNVRLPLAISGRLTREGEERAAALLAATGLADRAGEVVTGLSAGEQQRIAIVRALVRRPAVVLADEPTGSLDSVSAERVLDLFVDVRRITGRSFVLATHDLAVAARSDRVLRLLDGRIVGELSFDGEPGGTGHTDGFRRRLTALSSWLGYG